MQITLNITEDSKVELVKDSCELVQGECCFTDFVFNFPETIKGHAISEYTKTIEFAECKEFGECVKFVAEIMGDKYELDEACTAFKKIMVQIVLTRVADGKKITWKTVPFTLEFAESINAEGEVAIQAQLLNLAAIEAGWEGFVNANCVQVIKASANIPSPENCDCGVMFYLGITANGYTYGHYYKAVERDGVWIWEDINPETTVTDVANGIRELNRNRVIQFFKGTLAEYNADENLHDNIIFIPEGTSVLQEIEDEFNKIEEMLDNLGFIEGSATVSLGSATQNNIKRQGNYCILNLKITNYGELQGLVATLPAEFRPKETITMLVGAKMSAYDYVKMFVAATCTISTNGEISIDFVDYDGAYVGYYPYEIYLENIGYEASPIE